MKMTALNEAIVIEDVRSACQKCICEDETLSPMSSVFAADDGEENSSALERSSPDALYEVMRFLYPVEWGKLAMISTSMTNAVVPIR